MNKIIAVERGILKLNGASKYYEIIITKDGLVTVVPPFADFAYFGDGIRLSFEQALLHFKSVTTITDEDKAVCSAAELAAQYFGRGRKYDGVLSALGELTVALIAARTDAANVSPTTETVRADIAAHVSDIMYSLEDSIKKLPLNYDYVRKLFKKELGVTPHEYLLDERMKLARGLILGGISNRYSPYSVSQIAEACGFAEPLYFSRVFKKYFGVAPSEYGK